MSMFSGAGTFLAFQVIFEYIIDSLRIIFFGMKSYSEENVEGKVVIVTGANSGIGKATAFEFAKRGAIVIMACRNLSEGQKALGDIENELAITRIPGNKQGNLEIHHLDLGDLSSVRKFAQEINSKYKKVHILVNNAGLSDVTGKLPKTKDGFEPHMGVNHLGHFLLTDLLLTALRNGSPSRVVVVSSTMLFFNGLKLDDLMLEKAGVGKGYSNSKYANALFVKELGNRLAGTGVNVYSMCPGIVNTSITRHSPNARRWFWKITFGLLGFNSEQGCQTIIYCALAKEVGHESGKFYRFGKSLESVNSRLDNRMAKKLWEISEEFVGIKKQM